MSLRKTTIGVAALSLLLLASAVSFGQIGRVGGKVLKKDADGKPQVVAGVKIACYRTDTDQKCRAVETDARGEFVILGLPIGGRFILGVSGPGLDPTFVPETVVGGASENLEISVTEGDGSEATEEQVRASAASVLSGDLTEDQKKAQAEIEKKRLEIIESNKKIEANNTKRQRLSNEGKEAYDAKDYDTAILKFKEGYEMDPDFLGAAPQFLNNLGASLKQRGVVRYLEAAATKNTPTIDAARPVLAADISASLVELFKARALLASAKTGEISNAASIQKDNDELIKNDFNILAQVNLNLIRYEDPDDKRTEGLQLYRKGFEAQPSNLDIMAGLSLALFIESGMTGNNALKQESLNLGSQFLKKADANHKLMAAVKPIMDLLLEEGLKPEAMK